MWILDTEGDVFQGKRLWLRPGKKFLFGRTGQASAGGGFVVSDKTISRQHLTVEVEAVGANDCSNPRSRSKITLTDLETKIGTLVNDEQIRGQSHVIEKDVNEVILGRHKHPFRFTWVPVTFSFSFTTKEQKADPYAKLFELLGPLDIKVLVDYESGLTTHVAAKKRNTSKGLQALIDGRFIVHNDSYIQAVVSAATPVDGGLSPLEEDFETYFPDPLHFLPPRGEEPTQRDGSAYAPDLARSNMFEGYTFVFYEKRQFDNLLAPITQGRGKAMLREAIPGDTEVDDFVRYVKGVAGEKGLGSFDDGSEGKGVVVVRYNPVKGAGTEWFADFGRRVSLLLDHRLVEQNEFLDAILGIDASVLRRPLEIEMSGTVGAPPTAATVVPTRATTMAPVHEQIQNPPRNTAPLQEPLRRGRSRRVPASKFRGFDDDDDDFGPPISSHPASMGVGNPLVESQSHGLFVSQDSDHQPTQQPEPPARGRKRPAPIEEDIIETMAPAATALKKRRLAEENARKRRGESTPPPPVQKRQPVVFKEPQKKAKAKQDVDVMEVARQQHEKAEQLAKEEREALVRELDGMDIEAIRDLAVVEEMEVKRARPPPRVSRADESDRWDDKWNGRKNFKKFRHRGTESTGRGINRVIVQLEEVKKKDFGIGDDYWLDGDKDSQRRKNKGKEREIVNAQSQSQARSSGKSRAAERASGLVAQEVEDDRGSLEAPHTISSDEDPELVEQPLKLPARSQPLQTLSDKTKKSQNLPANNKRAAATTLSKPAPAKKARQTLIREEESDDSDDDGLRFKFRRK